MRCALCYPWAYNGVLLCITFREQDFFWVSKPAAQCTASPTVYNPGFESSTFLYLPAIGSGGRRRPRQSEAAHSAGHATSCQTETQQNLVTLAL